MNALEVRGLQKSFGRHLVLQEVDFAVRQGTILGFVGRNGAGKTTTMKILTGLMAGDSGEIFLGGRQVPPGLGYKGVPIGYLPDVPVFYNFMRPLEYLTFCGEIMGEDPVVIKERSNELLELVGLKGVKKRIGTFSRGMKQRLGMAQALMGEPSLLLCDEPTSALDPLGRREVLELISQIKKRTTVVFSTHVLTDVEQVCDDVAILHGGRIVYCGSMNTLMEEHSAALLSLKLRAGRNYADFSKELETVLPQADLAIQGLEVTIQLPVEPTQQEQAITALWTLIWREGIVLDSYSLQNPTLEQVFVEVTQ